MPDTEVSTTPIWVDGTVSATNMIAGRVTITGGSSGLRSTSTITVTGLGGTGTVHVQATVHARDPGNKSVATGVLGAVVRSPGTGTNPTFIIDIYRLSGTGTVDVYWFAVRGP